MQRIKNYKIAKKTRISLKICKEICREKIIKINKTKDYKFLNNRKA